MTEFSNKTWHDSHEKEFFVRTLKTIRYHKAIDRLDGPTTTLIFVSQFSDLLIRQHFEESSRHFKTYNTFRNISVLFKTPEESRKSKLSKIPLWILDTVDFLLGIKVISLILKIFLKGEFKEHFSYRAKLRSMTMEELATELSSLFHLIGVTSFSQLNVLIGTSEDKSVEFGVRFICKTMNEPKMINFLLNEGIVFPEKFQTCYGIFRDNKLSYKSTTPVTDINKPLMRYLEKKTLWVIDRKKVKGLIDIQDNKRVKTIIIGRRLLTRGHDPLNETSLIQSYDYKSDLDLKLIQRVLKSFLESLKQSNSEALIVIENFPNQISYLISRDDELKTLLNGNTIALACIEPETKDIYVFEGNQFIQKSLKHIY